MSIVGAAFLPHTPLLLPTTDPAHAKRVRQLRLAVEEVVQWSHAAQPDIVLCFNPHASSIGNQFTFNLADHYEAHFDEFGDLSTHFTIPAAPMFGYKLKERLEALLPVASIIEPRVQYGTGIPAYFWQASTKQPAWVEISTRRSTPADHIRFGARLQESILNSPQRVFIVATGEITGRLTDAAPQGKSAEAPAFHRQWLAAMAKRQLLPMLETVTVEHAVEVGSCGAWSIAQLLGVIASMKAHVQVLYEGAPYGVAYAVATWQPA